MNESGKILILKENIRGKDALISILIAGNKAKRIENCAPNRLMSVYKGRVDSVSKSINACFINIGDKDNCFMSLKGNENIKPGDEIVVQLEREAMGKKLPSVTTDFLIPGRFLILTHGKPGINFSGKIELKDRHRIKHALSETEIFTDRESSEYGVIIRANVKDLDDFGPLLDEYARNKKVIEEINAYSDTRTLYSTLYKSDEPYISFIKNTYISEYDEIITELPDVYESLKNAFPGENIRLYKDDLLSLSKLYSVESRINEALGSRIWLKSGGWLSIQSTEALTAIDVNSGKNEGKNKNQKQLVLEINKEAAGEIMDQLVLRNISGVIICDFINMNDDSDKNELMKYLKDLSHKDPVKCDVIDITRLGLVEITRKKVNKTLREQFDYEAD